MPVFSAPHTLLLSVGAHLVVAVVVAVVDAVVAVVQIVWEKSQIDATLPHPISTRVFCI